MIDEIRFRAMGTSEGQVVIVLQVCLYELDYLGHTTSRPVWRDAKVEDLLEVGKVINRPSYPTTNPDAPTIDWKMA